jgi:hypothetical protein
MRRKKKKRGKKGKKQMEGKEGRKEGERRKEGGKKERKTKTKNNELITFSDKCTKQLVLWALLADVTRMY